MKVAISGKGGVGKTTVAGTLARLLGKDGLKILAVDADPNYNLWSSLGIKAEIAKQIVPITENEVLIEERTQPKYVPAYADFFRLTPRVDDLTERFAVPGPDNVNLLVAGTVVEGDSGCMCRSGTLLKALIRHLVLGTDEAFVMDMDAGIENLGRGTTKGMDALIVVVEPGRRSLDTMSRIKKLASDINIGLIFVIGNKAATPEDEQLIKDVASSENIPLLGILPLDESIREADRKALAPLDLNPESPGMLVMNEIKKSLVQKVSSVST